MPTTSYWEDKWFKNYDFAVIGGGIVGCFTALKLIQEKPNARIAIFERGLFPLGASTKNAGFACFGSLTELENDRKHLDDDDVKALVKLRYEGLQLLRNTLGDEEISYQENGGFELFMKPPDEIETRIKEMNALMYPIFKENIFSQENNRIESNGFAKNKVSTLLKNKFEGSIDTGKMMWSLHEKVRKKGIALFTSTNIENFKEQSNGVLLEVQNEGKLIKFKTQKLAICTNAFSEKWLQKEDINPGRGMVLITKPISNLKINGCFHYHQGYHYFRNIDNRVLIGGGRQLDIEKENTSIFGTNDYIKKVLIDDLKNYILPNTPFKIEKEWSGIMAFGTNKLPLIKSYSSRIAVGVRLGGMGVAIGSIVGNKTAEILLEEL
ncbi:MAG: NAD(P)/FAD-dependent oxidoreductase [Flavobacteriaceae bacterium]